ncbi:MAG: YncE family protein [Gemmatimonadota bacterium]
MIRALALLTLLAAGPVAAAGGKPVEAAAAALPDDGPDDGPAGRKPHFLYVANQSAASVSVIDMQTDVVVWTIDLTALGFSEDARPHHVAVEPDGSFLYVSLIGDGFVIKLTPEGELRGQAEFETPGMLALDPHSARLWVSRSMMAVSPPQRIGVINRDRMTIEEVGVFFDRPHALALSNDGRLVFVGSLAENRFAVLAPDEEGIGLKAVEGPTHVLVQFAVSPDGRWLAVGGEVSGKLLAFDLAYPRNPRLVASIDVAPMPWHPIFSPDGGRLYFGNQGANVVTVVRTSDWTVEKVIASPELAQPHGIALSPDGSRLYVGNRNLKGPATGGMDHAAMGHDAGAADDGWTGRVVVIDTGTLEVVRTIDVGRYASGMGTATPVR